MDTAVDALNQRRKPSNEILAANERAALVLVPSVWDRSYRRVPLVSGRQWHDLVAPMLAKQFAPPDVRAAIAGFLNECQKEARPFARIEELGAIRAIFPNLDIPDADLEDAVASEAAKPVSTLIGTIAAEGGRYSGRLSTAGTTRAGRPERRLVQKPSGDRQRYRLERYGEPRRRKTKPVGLVSHRRVAQERHAP